MSACVTKLITRLPPEKAAVVVRSMDEAERHYQATLKYYETLDKAYEDLLINIEQQKDMYILQLSTLV